MPVPFSAPSFWTRFIFAFLIASSLISCQQSNSPTSTGPPRHLTQRGYLWQRYWSPSVKEAVHLADARLDGIVVLGAEIGWDGTLARPVLANLDWEELRGLAHPCSLGVRVAPFSGSFEDGDVRVGQIAGVIQSILNNARSHGVQFREIQLDFDCPQSKLVNYQRWLRQLKPVVSPTRLVITTLPAWLKEAAFPDLVSLADGYVLQVHSVPTSKETGRASLCDPALARHWVGEASALGLPFSVALPTYWCVAGYNPQGHLISVAMDSIQPAWPPGTHTLDFSVEPDVVADLVRGWQENPPAGMQEILWYRLPVASDERNWRWPTLQAVMQGRKPVHRLEVRFEGTDPADVFLRNSGEAEERFKQVVSVDWQNSAPVTAADALQGWSVRTRTGAVDFSPPAGDGLRLSPGSEVAIGWVRFQGKTELSWKIAD